MKAHKRTKKRGVLRRIALPVFDSGNTEREIKFPSASESWGEIVWPKAEDLQEYFQQKSPRR